MSLELIMLLNAAYLRKIINPNETNLQTAEGITSDLKRFRAYLKTLDKAEINQ